MKKHITEKIILIDRAALKPYANNARTHSDEQINQIIASITEFGFTNPLLVDEEYSIIAGHGRLAAATKMSMGKLPCVVVAGLTEAQRKALVLADNKIALNSGWDTALLKIELGSLADAGFDLSLTGFGELELNDLLIDKTEGLTDPDDVPELLTEAVTVLGDVWLLGNHRLVCGDTSLETVVENVLIGKSIDLVVTSPPYNQKIDGFKSSGMHKEGGWVDKVSRLAYADSKPEREYQEWQRDLLALWWSFCKDGASVFYNHKNRYRDKKVVGPGEWLPGPFALRQEIIWRRPGSVTQNARMFLPCDERIYWMYKGDDFTFNDTTEIKTWSSVWDIKLEANKSHAVAFPTELPLRAIRAASMPGDCILEPFSGSGTTIIAAEMTGRMCHAIELSPTYVDVAVKRWQSFTGKTATLEATGQTFVELETCRKIAA